MPDMHVDGILPISMPEIAELAGVHRPVVTTWRRRYRDFPAPIGGDASRPLFDARQVVDWLVETGRAERGQIEADLGLYLLGCLGAKMPAKDLVAAATALICLRHLDDELLQEYSIAQLKERAAEADPQDALLLSEIRALPDDAGWLASVVDELIEAAWGCRQAFERLLAVRGRLNVADLYLDAVTPELARLIAGLSGAREHAEEFGTVRVADPAARAGDLLVAVLGQLSEDSFPVFTGAEPDPFLARIARRRLVVHGIPPHDIDIRCPGDPPLPADVLVTRLPYVPLEERPQENPLATVKELTDGLAPGQTTVVLGPADVLVDGLPPYRPAARTRNELLASGRVEAVIHLPGGLVPFRPGYQTALWVLRREEPSPWQGRVLLADVSDRALTDDVVETLIWDVVTWRRDGYQPNDHSRAIAVQVAVSSLTSSRVRLTARRPPAIREVAAKETIARVYDLESELHRIADPQAVSRPQVRSGLAVRESGSPVPTAAIGALVKTQRLIMVKGTRLAASDVIPDGQHAVLGAPEIAGASPVGARTVDRAVLAEKYPRARLTEPGDVIVTMSPRFGVHVDHDGFSVVEFPARILRIPEQERQQLTPRVLAALLAAGHAGTRAAGAVRPASRLDELCIPLLPPAEVRRLDELLAVADERRRLARREIDLLDEVCRITAAGLSNGTLTIASTPITDQ
ncbi:N-6 DNA methylase [Thermobispora bispora DSM 43833]|uniref:N-6 DNA methylase n=1 Tax=Thermobispora bispora (strain ATCC 19993 / DSM 43833 / CBS 139.67 / JCM 10125 / KCTC 9307 / NBRC 14880 / R51) TaxID=469371 RepID=D6Y4N7_THEBD|nr:N-6 DNA methylase [Thermobispora bispora DSM 43833]